MARNKRRSRITKGIQVGFIILLLGIVVFFLFLFGVGQTFLNRPVPFEENIVWQGQNYTVKSYDLFVPSGTNPQYLTTFSANGNLELQARVDIVDPGMIGNGARAFIISEGMKINPLTLSSLSFTYQVSGQSSCDPQQHSPDGHTRFFLTSESADIELFDFVIVAHVSKVADGTFTLKPDGDLFSADDGSSEIILAIPEGEYELVFVTETGGSCYTSNDFPSAVQFQGMIITDLILNPSSAPPPSDNESGEDTTGTTDGDTDTVPDDQPSRGGISFAGWIIIGLIVLAVLMIVIFSIILRRRR